MVSRVLVAMAALIAVAHAQDSSTFALRWTPNNWEVVSGTFEKPTDCFARTNLTLPFTYGFTYDSSFTGTGEAAPNSIEAQSCGNAEGRVNMYSDMVFAYPRDANANPVCLRKLSGGSIGNLNKPDDTQTTFNQNYKYAITRNLQVCLYDSRFAPWNTNRSPSFSPKQQQDQENADAVIKVSYQADTWTIYASNWDGSLSSTSSDWASINTWCAGHCATVGSTGVVWENPSNELYNGVNFSPSGRDQDPFRNGDCQEQSGWTCDPSASDPIKSCTFAVGPSDATNYRPAATGGANDATPVEMSACGSSNQLLARSANFNHAGFDVDNFNKLTGLTATNAPGTTTPYLYTVTPDQLDQTIGIHEDIIKMWTQVSSMFAPTITHFQGKAVSVPNYKKGKTFYLNNGDLATFKFNNANTEYNQIGYATADTNDDNNWNKVMLSSDLGAGSSAPELTPVAFDRTNGEASFLAQNGRFSSSGQGDGDFGVVGRHYWARVWSQYRVQFQWTCINIGQTDAGVYDPMSGTKYPYRFSCDDKIADYISTPGQKYNNNANKFPTMKRQFTQTLYKQWSSTYTFSATSDPVYLGQFISATNNGFSVATPVAAVDGSAARATTPQEDATAKQTTAAEDQATGVALIGAGVVVLAVFGSLAICIGAGILGKMQAMK